MNTHDRLMLIGRVLNAAMVETETWENEDGLGTFLAYLAHAIAGASSVDLWKGDPRDSANLRFFQSLFPDDDSVWNYINVRAD